MNAESRTRQDSRIPITAILVIGFGCAALAAATAMLVVSKRMPSASNSPASSAIDDLVTRLEVLENHHTNTKGKRQPQTANGPKATESEAVEVVNALAERITQLEKIQEAREATDRRQAEFTEHLRRISEVYTHDAALRAMADPSADDETKATAWRTIRYSADLAWTDAIVMEAVRIGTTSSDPWLRADIWRQAHANHTNPLLLQPLLQALANDPDARVRSEAAETLDLYIDEIGVREALQNASEIDADPDVRQQALSSLKGPDGGY